MSATIPRSVASASRLAGSPAPNWFVALKVPPGTWFTRVGEPLDGVRLFHPDDLHITVAFLGPVDAAAAERAFEVASRWPTGAIEISLGRVEAMGNPRRPSALSARVERGAATVADAISTVRDQMCDVASARRDTRPPLPHATIARPRRRASRSETRAAVEWARGVDLGEPQLRLTELSLYTWSPDRRERLFREAATLDLGKTGTGTDFAARRGT